MLKSAEPLLLVGAGKMGGAMLDGWLERGLDGRQVTVLDPFVEADRRAALVEGRRDCRRPSRMRLPAAASGCWSWR